MLLDYSLYTPIYRYLFIILSTSISGYNFFNSQYTFKFSFSTILKVVYLSLWAPPNGILIILSISLFIFISVAVSFNASAALSLCSQLRQSLDEQLSGDITDYQVCSSINTLSPTPIRSAPP